MTLQDNIKEWIKIDNEITSLNSRIKELRDSKKPDWNISLLSGFQTCAIQIWIFKMS